MIGLSGVTVSVNGWGGVDPIPPEDQEFKLIGASFRATPRIVGGVPTGADMVIDDVKVFGYTHTKTYYDGVLVPLYTGTKPIDEEFVFAVQNPHTAVTSINASGEITHSGGFGTVVFTCSIGGATVEYELVINWTPTDTHNFIEMVAGSAAYHCSEQLDTMIGGDLSNYGGSETAPHTGEIKLFTTEEHTSEPPVYVRNQNAWCASLGSALNCISPWNTQAHHKRAGVAVSPVHILFAAHYHVSAGQTMRFVLQDNSIVERVILGTQTLSEYAWGTYGLPNDITLGLVDPLPSEVGFAKVLPSDYKDYFPSLGRYSAWKDSDGAYHPAAYALPVMTVDQEEKCLITEFLKNDNDTITNYVLTYPEGRGNSSRRGDFSEKKIDGDSGSPSFLIIDGELVLIGVLTSGGAGGGSNIVNHKAELNQIMTQLGGTYQLDEVDLSGFTNYGA